jgi:hypothetical protein
MRTHPVFLTNESVAQGGNMDRGNRIALSGLALLVAGCEFPAQPSTTDAATGGTADASAPPHSDAAQPNTVAGQIRFTNVVALDSLPPLPADGSIVARAISVRYGQYRDVSKGNGRLPSAAEVREGLGQSLREMIYVAAQPGNQGLIDGAAFQSQLDQLAGAEILVTAIALVATRDAIETYAIATQQPYELEITEPIAPASNGALPLIQDSGQESDWTPNGGTVTWHRSGPAPGILLKFWFDQRALRHYQDNGVLERDAWEIQVNLKKECFVDLYDNFQSWTPTRSNLPDKYVDWNCLVPDDNGTYEGAAGTSRAAALIPWLAPDPYYVWIPVRPRPDAPSSCQNEVIKVWSQPSRYLLLTLEPPTTPSPFEPSLLTACHVFSRDFAIPNLDPADDETALISFTQADMPDGREVAWARNMCSLTTSTTEGLAPCIFHSDDNFAECFPSCTEGTNRCTSAGTCAPAVVQRQSGSIYQLGHGFTRNSTARCYARSFWTPATEPPAVEVAFDVHVGNDSEFTNLFTPILTQEGRYSLQCLDGPKQKWSNRVFFEVTAPPGVCTCQDQDTDAYFPPPPMCADTDCPRRSDCNDSVFTMNPGRTEVCGNGIDDDCSSATADACSPSCTPDQTQGCYDGDVYSYDSCGVRGARVSDCTVNQTCVEEGDTATCSASSPPPSQAGELLVNPGFEDPADDLAAWGSWEIYRHAGRSADTCERVTSGAFDGTGFARCHVAAPAGEEWHFQLLQPGVRLENALSYRVSFCGRSPTGSHAIRLVTQVHQGGDRYGLDRLVTLTADWNCYDVDFVASGITGGVDTNSRFTFFLLPSAQPATIELDRVSLRPITGGCTSDQQCAATSYCSASGACTADVCTQGQDYCDGNDLRRCALNGGSSSLLQACAVGCGCGQSTQMLVNPGFESATDNLFDWGEWSVYRDAGRTNDTCGRVVGAAPEGSAFARCEVAAPAGLEWHFQLAQPGLLLENGRSYRVKFRGRVTSGTHDIRLITQMQNGGDRYGLDQPVTLTTSWSPYDVVFQASGITMAGGIDPNSRFTFFLNPTGSPVTVEIDDVSLVPL